jgi:hypothetical protein
MPTHALNWLLMHLLISLRQSEITFLMIMLPFNQLGSQTCEKAFWSARSMSSTFSTVINYSILGLLWLHHLQIQSTLLAESSDISAIFPRVQKYEGKNNYKKHSIGHITNDLIDNCCGSSGVPINIPKKHMTGNRHLICRLIMWFSPCLCLVSACA